MTETGLDADATDLPYTTNAPCKACGSTDYANANLSPRDLKPDSCDKCPPVEVQQRIHRASQEIF